MHTLRTQIQTVALCLLSSTTVSALQVTNTSDTGPGSLRQALADAPAGSTIIFAPSLSGRTIELSTTGLVLSRNVSVDASSLPRGVTINGDANEDGSTDPEDVRVLHVQSDVVATINGLTIAGGYAASDGGGIFNEDQLTLSRCTIAGNAAGVSGGGIATTGNLTLHHCTLAGNTAQNHGGAIHGEVVPLISLNHCTVSANSAGQWGGGLFTGGSTVSLRHTIIAENIASLGPDFYGQGQRVTASSPVLLGANDFVSEQIPAGPLAGTAAYPVRPRLAPFGYYGGPTMTMPPLIGSPALDVSVPATAPGTDQRGFPRVVGGRLDLGAVEGYYVKSHGAWDVEEIILASGQIGALSQAEALLAAPGTATVLGY